MSRTPGAFSRAEKMREAARSDAYAATSPRKSYMFKLQPRGAKLMIGAALAGAAVGIVAAKAWRKGERGGTYYLTSNGKRVCRRR